MIKEVKMIKEAKDVQMAIGHVISNRSNIGWTTGSHVGGDVALYCYTSGSNIKKLSGTVHNNEIGKYLAAVLGLDLDKLTAELYIPARQAFEKEGAHVKFVSDKKTNYQIEVTKDGKTIIFPASKSYALVDGKKVDLGGLVIYNTKTVYVPQRALELVK